LPTNLWKSIFTTVPYPTPQLWNRVVDGVLCLAGIYGIVRGLTAEKLTFHPLGWMPGREREEFTLHWYHRVLMVLVGTGLALQSLLSLLGFHWRR
jgi:hypothetical protein